jgi:hypothetical protein
MESEKTLNQIIDELAAEVIVRQKKPKPISQIRTRILALSLTEFLIVIKHLT